MGTNLVDMSAIFICGAIMGMFITVFVFSFYVYISTRDDAY